MWGGRKLGAPGSRLLGVLGSGSRTGRAERPRVAPRAGECARPAVLTPRAARSRGSGAGGWPGKAGRTRGPAVRPWLRFAGAGSGRSARRPRRGCAAAPLPACRGAGSVRALRAPVCPLPGSHRRESSSRGSPCRRPHSTSQSTVDSSEVRRFLALAHKWWDEQGVYAPLHSLNDLRVPFIRDNILKTVGNHEPGKPLSGMRILDVGCGGGLLTEPLGRLGASVIGIDPLDENIKTAQHHKSFDPVLAKRIEYRVCPLEEIVEETKGTFDAVVASEVVEHVIDLETFIQCCCQVLKPGGSLFITTINKTQLSYALGIVFAEYFAGIVPKGTHTWEKFVSPEMLESILESNGLSVQTVVGMLYNPFSGYWRWSDNTSLNYAAHAVRCTVQEHSAPAELVDKGETEEPEAKSSSNPSV
ncbi:ubiquinone biosynthesis O-methyltransferase, mitochondrial [Ctenodactylus gundi]